MTPPLGLGGSEYWIQWLSNSRIITPLTIFNNVSPLPCSHPACSKFCVHLEFLPEIVCKVEKVPSTFHTFHDYLNFCGEKKDGWLLTIYSGSDYFRFLLRNFLPEIFTKEKAVLLSKSSADSENQNGVLNSMLYLSF